MKSNIGLVFVVNSEKAFGRFVKEFAGEEEIGRVGGHFQPTAVFTPELKELIAIPKLW